jgi:hypothetical protein
MFDVKSYQKQLYKKFEYLIRWDFNGQPVVIKYCFTTK